MDDTRLRSALHKAHILNYVDSLNGGLEHEITEDGQTFSVGQRQLLCLARALLRRSQFLILDEATASVDLETDRLIQKTIRENFSASTILTIAHRLDTIRDFDRVMVMEQGRLVEFDRIDRLLKNKNSRFARMVRASHGAF
ncbi:Multidrug resistance-associated protein 1-like, protein [Aphelenchoides besseyi]|nr:Multidrug resistance-associated protein 1-like, protein [Aphelenchoides besseyi]